MIKNWGKQKGQWLQQENNDVLKYQCLSTFQVDHFLNLTLSWKFHVPLPVIIGGARGATNMQEIKGSHKMHHPKYYKIILKIMLLPHTPSHPINYLPRVHGGKKKT